MLVHIVHPAAVLRKTTFLCIVGSFSLRNLQWHQRGLLVVKIRNLVRMQVLVSQHSISGFTGHAPETLQNFFYGW
ncbi:hypothetical protein E2C01_040173 [Portunus trituberculatus]|uniref:Uncharacterized protein n=1 Tax=Portunus trituberculatus TaxID=210409 RepID=A0A5B7FN19_PORTR|nr:hypothetical protein [Portunus trituberculatus]